MVPGLAVRLKMCSTGTARFHLGCEITEEGETLEVVWLFRESLFYRQKFRNWFICLRPYWLWLAVPQTAEKLPLQSDLDE